MTKVISSLQNPLIKNVLLLGEKPRARKEQNRIVIEGHREIRLAIMSGFSISDLLFAPELVSPADLNSLTQEISQASLTEVSQDVFNRMAYRKDAGGLIALAKPRRLLFSDLQ